MRKADTSALRCRDPIPRVREAGTVGPDPDTGGCTKWAERRGLERPNPNAPRVLRLRRLILRKAPCYSGPIFVEDATQ